MEIDKQALCLTKEMVEDLYIIAAVYHITVEEVIRELSGAEYDVEYVA